MGSMYVHSNLAADAHMVVNARNCLVCRVPVDGRFCQVVCYKPWQLDWLPMYSTKFKHVHMVITDGHSQKVSFEVFGKASAEVERWVCLDMRNRERERHGSIHHTAHLHPVPLGPWSRLCL